MAEVKPDCSWPAARLKQPVAMALPRSGWLQPVHGLLLLQLGLCVPSPCQSQGCASDHQETLPCCGQQTRDPGCPATCTVAAEHRCSAAKPVCTNYVYSSHFGTCAPCPAATPGGCDEPSAKLPEMLKLVELGVCPACETNWGLPLLVILAAGSLLYLAGGVAFAIKTQGASPADGLAAHPHSERFTQLAGLVQDGLTFTAARVQAARGGASGADSGSEAVGGERNAPLLVEAAVIEEEGTASPAAAGKEDTDSGSDDGLVE